MPTIADNLASIKATLPSHATLIAVSKKKPLSDIQAAYSAGQIDFGENYVQEGVAKIQEAKNASKVQYCANACWHFIGNLQSNKSREVAEHFDWVHTIDRLKIARHLSQYRPTELPALNVCVQVNIDGGENKSGVTPSQTEALCEQIIALPNLKLRGLMVIPEPNLKTQQPSAFADMQALFQQLQSRFSFDTLSMGMSNDFTQAIEFGATHVRIGTAIFGQRSN